MHVQITARALVVEHVLVDPLMTNLLVPVQRHPARDLFRAPVSAQLLRYQLPRLRLDALMRLLPPRKRNHVRLFWPVPALTTVATQLAADR